MTTAITQAQFDAFERDGYVVVEEVLTAAEVGALLSALDLLEREADRGDAGVAWSGGRVTSIQTLPLQRGALSAALRYRPLLGLIERLVGGPARLTGGLLLDKDPNHNWAIGWHQDNGIYVDALPPGEPNDVRGGLPVLSTKGMELAGNVSCRIALDPSTRETGGLFVLPGSHRSNLGPDGAQRFADQAGVIAHQPPGAALFFRPLLLHRSEKMTAASRRRTLHLQYGPLGLRLPGANCYPWPQPCPLTPLDQLEPAVDGATFPNGSGPQ